MAYPNNYREADLIELLTRMLVQKRCVWMVGVGSVGKTHLIEHLSDYQSRSRPVQTYLMGKLRLNVPDLDVVDPADLVFVRIDPNSMLDPDSGSDMSKALPQSWYGFELILRNVVEICDILDIPGEETTQLDVANKAAQNEARTPLFYEQIRNHYNLILDPSQLGPQRAYAVLEDAVHLAFTKYIEARLSNNRRRSGRLIIVFDEFERLVKLMPNEFFLNLRALRDRFRYKLLFLVVARKEAFDVIPSDRRKDLEPFTELFQAPLYITGSRTANDQQIMIDYLTKNQNWTEQEKKDALRVTGSHGGLLRSVVLQSDLFEHHLDDKDLIERLLERNDVVGECHIMLESVSPRERQVLDAVLAGKSIDLSNKYIKKVFDTLIGKQILLLQSNTIYWAIPLFARFYYGYRNNEYPNEPYPPDTLPI